MLLPGPGPTILYWNPTALDSGYIHNHSTVHQSERSPILIPRPDKLKSGYNLDGSIGDLGGVQHAPPNSVRKAISSPSLSLSNCKPACSSCIAQDARLGRNSSITKHMLSLCYYASRSNSNKSSSGSKNIKIIGALSLGTGFQYK